MHRHLLLKLSLKKLHALIPNIDIMKKQSYMLFILFIGLLSCSEHKDGGQKDYIAQVDFSLLMPDTINGETVAQSNERGKVFMNNLESNTIHKYIPNIPVQNLSGREFNLQDIITKSTILISSDSYCGFGGASLRNDFPAAMDSLKHELQDYDIICLVKRTDADKEDSTRFERFTAELGEIYEKIYKIEESDAYKMNLYGNPVRYYIDKDQKVAHIAGGLTNVEYQIFEIRNNTGIDADSISGTR